MSNLRTFSEVIKVKDGKIYNLPFHIARMNRTTNHFFGTNIDLDLTENSLPLIFRKELIKCRIVYSNMLLSADFTPYFFRPLKNVSLFVNDTIDYSYKYTDRTELNNLLARSGYDDVIIVRDGCITDSTYANLVFQNESGNLFTPDTFLLKGVKRESLLSKGYIKECRITPFDIKKYTKIYLINAMIDIEDDISLWTKDLKF